MRVCLLAVISTAVLLSALSACAVADDGYVQAESGTVVALSHSRSIRMVSETVRITDLPVGKVHAVFTFKNDGSAADVLIGFPENNIGVDVGPVPKTGNELVDFKSWVDGRPVTVVRDHAFDSGADENYQAFWVKRVNFRRGQTHIVEDSYSGTVAGESNGEMFFDYILQTGSSWDGPIGKAVVIANVRGLDAVELHDASPSGYTRTPSTVTWTFHNLTPDQNDNIMIGWFPAFVRVLINGKQVADQSMSGLSEPSLGNDPRAPQGATVFPKRVGKDVLLAAKTAALWLGVRFAVERPGGIVRLEIGRRWVQAVTGSHVLTTSSGRDFRMPAAAYVASGSATGTRYTMVYLAPIVRALGGETQFDVQRDVMRVRFPH